MKQQKVGPGRFTPSPAMAVALLALFVAMGGSAWAVAKVGTNQIKNNAVTTPKIKPSAVNGSRIANGAVTSSKIGQAAVTTEKIAGGAIKGGLLDDGTVDTRVLADAAVIGSKIADGTIDETKLGNAVIGTESLANAAVTADKIASGAVGGNKVDVVTVSGLPVAIPIGTSEIATATCPAGKTALSAGFETNTGFVIIYQQYVSGDTANVYAISPSGSEVPLVVTAQAVCI